MGWKEDQNEVDSSMIWASGFLLEAEMSNYDIFCLDSALTQANPCKRVRKDEI